MANYGDKGWIALWRSAFHNPLYDAEPFDKWHALMDLCMMADDEGTVTTSLKALKTRWFWGSIHKVREFLRSVEGMGWGTVYTTPNKGTLIRMDTGKFASKNKAKKKAQGTVSGTVQGIEEILPKEVGDATSLKSRRTPYNNQEKYTELLGELDNEYE